MSDMNVWLGQGRLTRDSELRYVPSGQAVMDLSIASNRVWSKDGQKQEETTFVDVTLWGKQAESLAPYLNKGTHISVEGRLKLDQWNNKEDGAKRSKISVTADRIHLTPRGSSGNSPSPAKKLDSNEYATSSEVPMDEVPF